MSFFQFKKHGRVLSVCLCGQTSFILEKLTRVLVLILCSSSIFSFNEDVNMKRSHSVYLHQENSVVVIVQCVKTKPHVWMCVHTRQQLWSLRHVSDQGCVSVQQWNGDKPADLKPESEFFFFFVQMKRETRSSDSKMFVVMSNKSTVSVHILSTWSKSTFIWTTLCTVTK